jgi:hypothetical protein
VATQFFFTLCFVGMLLAIAMVLMYLLCIDDYYRVKVLRWTGVDLLVSGASIISSRNFWFQLFHTFWIQSFPDLTLELVFRIRIRIGCGYSRDPWIRIRI